MAQNITRTISTTTYTAVRMEKNSNGTYSVAEEKTFTLSGNQQATIADAQKIAVEMGRGTVIMDAAQVDKLYSMPIETFLKYATPVEDGKAEG